MSDNIVVMAKTKEGWKWLSNSPKWHYFVDGRSLCGKWMAFGDDLEIGNDDSEDNCKMCRTRLKKKQEKEGV